VTGPAVVIGIGNPFRGDDGVGPAVVVLLAGRVGPGVRLVSSDGEPTRLLEQWRGAATAVVVDAAVGGGPPGSVRTFVLRSGDPGRVAPGGRTSCHGLGLAEALALAAALGTAPGHVVVHAVHIGSTAPGTGLSPAVREAAGEVADRVLADLSGTGAPLASTTGTERSAAGDVRP
jgi:hydrogenase maturation protease